MNSPSSKFSGPLFIVGMSRSGTTLLREIVCGSKQVAIPRAESLFLPYLIRHFGDLSYPLAEKPRKKLLSVVVKSSFFQSLPRHGIHVEKKHLGMILERGSLQAVVQGLNTIAATGLLETKKTIWGDKSPNNLPYLELLWQAFPESRYIHIIRDPRDRALSAKKAWGANIHISSERWQKQLQYARQAGLKIGEAYLEILYEELTAFPEKQASRICDFLEIDYNVKMLKWDVPFEQHTDSDSPTRRSVVVVGRNSGKFKKELKPKDIQAVEKLVFPLAAQWGYVPVSGQVEHTPLRPLPWCYNICGHFFNTLVFHIRRHGWKKGLTFLYWRVKMVFI